jgi:glyoxylase-like metal-dependent hydrolase (beta-lactamase superfamily II)
VLGQAKKLAGNRPLYLTVTHFHPEHGFGAHAFKGVATIVYNRGQRDELRRKGASYLQTFKSLSAAVASELADVRFVDPDILYDGQVEIDLGGRTAVLRGVGPAHTAGDQVVIVDERVLFGGDLLETRRFPILPYLPAFDVDVDGQHWIQILDGFLAWRPEIVVPGHGEVTDSSLINDVRDYLAFVRDEAARLHASGASLAGSASTIRTAARARWSTWDDPEWIDFAAQAFFEAAARSLQSSP